ncbi:MAG: hypothetical protein KGL90_04425 [Burkholderiales bacterium]|nr:hypothetical protein [Burkholderiales bacterium]
MPPGKKSDRLAGFCIAKITQDLRNLPEGFSSKIAVDNFAESPWNLATIDPVKRAIANRREKGRHQRGPSRSPQAKVVNSNLWISC